MMAVGAVAVGAVPGTLVHQAASVAVGGRPRGAVAGGGRGNCNHCASVVTTVGHPSGAMKVSADVSEVIPHSSKDCANSSTGVVHKVAMSHSARVRVEGWVRVPAGCF